MKTNTGSRLLLMQLISHNTREHRKIRSLSVSIRPARQPACLPACSPAPLPVGGAELSGHKCHFKATQKLEYMYSSSSSCSGGVTHTQVGGRKVLGKISLLWTNSLFKIHQKVVKYMAAAVLVSSAGEARVSFQEASGVVVAQHKLKLPVSRWQSCASRLAVDR